MSARKGEAKPQHTEEEKAAIVERVCELYETQHATLESCCAAAGVSDRLFYLWLAKNSGFSERYKKAKQNQDVIYWEEVIRPKAKTALEKLLEGQETEDIEIRELSDKGVLTGDKAQTVKRGRTTPNPTAVIFALKGEYPERFVERQDINIKSVGQPELIPITADKIKQIEAILANGKPDAEVQPVSGKRKG